MDNKVMLALFIVFAVCCKSAVSAPASKQLLPPIPGYVPVYIRVGDTPLEEINEELAEAFRGSARSSKSGGDLAEIDFSVEQMQGDQPKNSESLSEETVESNESHSSEEKHTKITAPAEESLQLDNVDSDDDISVFHPETPISSEEKDSVHIQKIPRTKISGKEYEIGDGPL